MKTPMVNVACQVYTTTDYTLFKTLEGNRKTNKLHLSRLKKSMQENYLLSPIIVNQHYEIIDGQHRFTIAKELGLPIYYIIAKGYGLKEIQTLNANTKNWNADDYLAGYIDMGKKDYIVYAEFKNKYNLGHNECMSLLCSATGTGGKKNGFYDGEFKVKSLKKATEIADFIVKAKVFYTGAVRRSFIFAIMSIWGKPAFDADYFLNQLEKHQSMMFDCPTTKAYLELIETIYNYRKRDKINLRF